jgi:acetyl-CoA carboxylase biotin carboxyl carrier protein|tara:strand:- start:608 stop:1030 length:423 start_codon:yes stop_codon:yes gene_type:complete
MKINKNLIKDLSDHLDEFNLTELSYSDGTTTIKVGKGNKSTISNAASAPFSPQEKEKNNEDDSLNLIKSPMVGTVYLSPEPGAKPFATVGAKIKKGSTIVIIEAMKTMNHIQATIDGELKELCVSDGEAIEFDQVIAKIK